MTTERPFALLARAPLPAPKGHTLADASVGPDGEPVCLWQAPWGGTVATVGSRAIPLESVPLSLSTPQPLPDGGVLAVARRSVGGVDDAVRYDADGRVVATARFGDGIEDVQVTPAGSVWVSWFDEGVFALDEALPQAHGLARYGPDLTLDWLYPGRTDELPPIYDCYALNVVGEDAWACYYDGFPIVRMSGGTVRVWRNEVAGASHLVVGDGVVALVGPYGDPRDRVEVVRLDAGHATPVAHARIGRPEGARLRARGAELHAFRGTSWWTASLG